MSHTYIPSIGLLVTNFEHIVNTVIIYPGDDTTWIRKCNLEDSIVHHNLKHVCLQFVMKER